MEYQMESLYALVIYDVMQEKIEGSLEDPACDYAITNFEIMDVMENTCQKIAEELKQSAETILKCFLAYVGYDDLGEFVDAILDSHMDNNSCSFDEWVALNGKKN